MFCILESERDSPTTMQTSWRDKCFKYLKIEEALPLPVFYYKFLQLNVKLMRSNIKTADKLKHLNRSFCDHQHTYRRFYD